MSFQLPLAASGQFIPMLEELDEKVAGGGIKNYGLSITTLNSVFLLVARGAEDVERHHESSKRLNEVEALTDDERSAKSGMDLEKENLFNIHVRALLKKRAANFKVSLAVALNYPPQCNSFELM